MWCCWICPDHNRTSTSGANVCGHFFHAARARTGISEARGELLRSEVRVDQARLGSVNGSKSAYASRKSESRAEARHFVSKLPRVFDDLG